MRIYIALALLVIFSSCVRNKSGQVLENSIPVIENKFEVLEVVQASSYSYLKVKENFADRWVAVTKQEIKTGDVFYYDNALEMANFKSKDLDRTFEVVYFINKISKQPISNQSVAQPKIDLSKTHKGKVQTGNAEIELNKSNGEITLSQVFNNSKKYASEEFEIRGIVVKFTPQVMGKNWVHIQDGTSYNGSFDLTITTVSELSLGDEVIFKGKLSLNKDFGYGYKYEVLMEDAVLVNKQTAGTSL